MTIERVQDMSETESTHETKDSEKNKNLEPSNLSSLRIEHLPKLNSQLLHLWPDIPPYVISEILDAVKRGDIPKSTIKNLYDSEELLDSKVLELVEKFKNEYENEIKKRLINLSIVQEPLTPQNMALIFTALTELTTKLFLIERLRFDDLIEYTQTHDIRFADEAGSSIVSASKNSPFNFGFQVDRLVPSVAEAVMTVVDGLSQRKAHQEKLEIENLAALQKIKEAEENLIQQLDMAVLEREKQEIALEKLRLEIEREQQTLIEHRLEAQQKQIEDALELAGKAVDIVYPNTDSHMRLMLMQTLVNNILQLHSATGLEPILPKIKDDYSSKEDVV
jgi:hypothetical protein